MEQVIKNEIFELAAELVNYTDKHVFLTGKAGTGKTTFLKYIKENTHKNVAIVAPTGVAAINAGGTTLHSFLQLPFGIFIPDGHRPFGMETREEINDRQSLVRKLRFSPNRRKVINALELLIIDEISMVRADLLDMVDTVLRFVRKKPQLPFGGVQVLYIGDMFQLPPVVREDDKDIINSYYKSPFFFDARVIQQAPPQYVELKHVYRQRDEIFVSVLNEVRNNELTEEGLQLLQQRYFPGFQPDKKENYITLATHNFMADQINNAELNALPGRPFTYEATIKNDFPESSYPVEKIIKLKLGAQVMFIKNDSESPRRFFNGKIGVVTDLDNEKIVVTCKGDTEPITVPLEEWKNIRYTYDAATRTVNEEELGSFFQFPLRLAWAITIHKSQGLTFEKAIIDAGRAFEAGQVYVALSRCTSLEGMVLRSPLNNGLVMTHERIAQFGRKERPIADLEQRTREGKRNYLKRKIQDAFNFTEATIKVATLQQHFEQFSDMFNTGMKNWLNVLQENMMLGQDLGRVIGESLIPLLDHAEDFEKDEALQTFLKQHAKELYTILQEKVWLHWRKMPGMQTGHTRRSAEAFFTEVELLNEWLKERLALLERLTPGFDMQTFFNRRHSVASHLQQLHKVYEEKQKAAIQYATKQGHNPEALKDSLDDEIPHRELYRILRRVTDRIVEREVMPSYIVASSKTLIALCKGLPMTKEDLIFIKGFSEKKAEQFGEEFLEAIRDYCTENKLLSSMDQYKLAHKKRERKSDVEGGKPKLPGPSYQESLRLWLELKSLPEVAKARSLAESTIAGHLAQAVAARKLDVFELTTKEVIDKIMPLLPDSMEGMALGAIKEKVGESISYNELKWALAWKKANEVETIQ
jgi:hypothetical protein